MQSGEGCGLICPQKLSLGDYGFDHFPYNVLKTHLETYWVGPEVDVTAYMVIRTLPDDMIE